MRILTLALAAATTASCNWISLGVNALRYETLAAGDAGNLVVHGPVAFVALGDSGLAVVSALDGARLRTVAPPAGMESVDDVAVADGLLFALDARPPGAVATFGLGDSGRLAHASVARSVDVGPFSGVSAAGGWCVVSGGTSKLSAWRYDTTGLTGDATHADLGRGQPDAFVAGAMTAYVSTHYWGPYFGLDVLERDTATDSLARVGRLRLDGAGFTAGGAKPANFPIETAVLDSVTLLVAHARGLAMIDVARPTAPVLVTVVDVGGPAVNVDAADGVAAVAVGGRTPAVVLVPFAGRTPGSVRRIELPEGSAPAGVAVGDRTVLVAMRGRGILAVER